MLTSGTLIPSAGMKANNSIKANPRIPPSSIIDDWTRYSGNSRTLSECVNMSGSIANAIIEIIVLNAINGITDRLMLTTWAIACCFGLGL